MAGKFKLADHIQPAVKAPRDIETITGEILQAKRDGGEAILTIGRGLIEAKGVLPHGEWLSWLERVEFSAKAAQRFMRLAREYSNPTALSDLGATKALMLLALPSEQREEFIGATHVVGGEEKTVVDMTSRELETVIKERDEARKMAEIADAERNVVEQARQKIEADMAMANERLAGLNAQLEEQTSRAKEAQDEVQRLSAELEELKNRPMDVVVETDANALQAARREAEEKTRATIERELEIAKAASQEQVIRANEEAAKVKTELERTRRELENLRFDLDCAKAKATASEKKAAMASNEDLVLFGILFDQVQEQINKMSGVMLKLRSKDADKAAGAAKALLALSIKIREVAEQ